MTDKPEWKSVGGTSGAPQRRPIRSAAAQSTARRSDRHNGAPAAKPNPKAKKSVGKRIAFWSLVTILLLAIAACAAFLFAYIKVRVPEPDEFALAQASTVYYNDGATELGKFAEVDRTIIDASTLPDYVGKAVVASEDRTFYSNSGVDLKGIFRALINNVTGGPRQGASTISQGYVENYYLGMDKEKTYLRKLEEAILALKVNRQVSKEQILGNYLNTIYFGRGTFGIEAASEAYFGKPAAELTLSESALLAGILPAPSAWDPAVDPDMAQSRWQRVLDLMVEDGWIAQADADAAVFPETIEPGSLAVAATGQSPYLLQQVYDELVTKGGLTADEIDSGGLTIVTTLDKAMQNAAVAAQAAMPEDTPDNVRVALSSIDNATGEILAEYPGSDYETNQMNAVTQDRSMAGSTFKPFALIPYIEQDGTVYDYFDGNSPQEFEGTEVSNNDDVSFGSIDLVTATMYSVNTVFMKVNEEVGPENTLKTLVQAGIPEDTPDLGANLANVLGSAATHNIDLTTAYATLANGGERISPHIVRSVTNDVGVEIYTANTERTRVFDAATISQIMPALEAVTSEGGTGDKVLMLGKTVAGKTGTSDDQRSAQFVGFTPKITTAVSMYAAGPNGEAVPLPNIGGLDQFHGSDWPTDVWLSYMQVATQGMPDEPFSWKTQPVRKPAPAPAPTPAPVTPEPTPEPTPTQPPSPPETTDTEPEKTPTDNTDQEEEKPPTDPETPEPKPDESQSD